jgi:hypothetical protein
VEAAGVKVHVHRLAAVSVAHLLLRLRRAGMHLHAADTGGYNCRRISGSPLWSLHGAGIAVDVNWLSSPYGQLERTDVTPEAVRLVQELRHPTSEAPLWAWGGHWRKPDAMHWQLNAKPEDLWWVK